MRTQIIRSKGRVSEFLCIYHSCMCMLCTLWNESSSTVDTALDLRHPTAIYQLLTSIRKSISCATQGPKSFVECSQLYCHSHADVCECVCVTRRSLARCAVTQKFGDNSTVLSLCPSTIYSFAGGFFLYCGIKYSLIGWCAPDLVTRHTFAQSEYKKGQRRPFVCWDYGR